jgi:cytochrome P450
MGVPVRDWTHWAVGYAPPRASFKLLARRGDPLAQLLSIDTYPVDDIYPLIEQVRQRGRVSPIPGAGWVTADAHIVRQVLRDGRFRTIKPQDRSPFRAVRWILAKTDPDVANPIEPPSMLVADPPEHTRLRRPVSRAFTPRALERLRSRVHNLADGLLRGLKGKTECDLVSEYTSRIPIAIITEMMGMPPDETGYLQEVAQATTRLIGSTAASWRDFRAGTVVLREFDR